MEIKLILISVLILIAGGIISLVFTRFDKNSLLIALISSLISVSVSIFPVLNCLINGAVSSVRYEWPIPYGSLFFQLDPMSAFFILCTLIIVSITSIYGYKYLQLHSLKGFQKTVSFFTNILVASIILVLISNNGLLFMFVWELMAISSFFLVLFESNKPENRHAAWIYLISTHIGIAFILIMFFFIGKETGNLDFNTFFNLQKNRSLIFFLALVGFGTKTGMIPLHIWLPEAHPAAPSHISALMSGIMIKTGIYGILRMLSFLGNPSSYWGITLVIIGSVSGLLGIIMALTQKDYKRLLAYCSVENIGIILIGLGIGILGLSHGHNGITIAGFCGALLHVFNHSVSKSILFLTTGSIYNITGTRNMELLGGLAKSAPKTASMFIIGSVAISGLPPLNGFFSEILIYLASFKGIIYATSIFQLLPFLVAMISLTAIGGFAISCFSKAFGIIFLGEPRTVLENVHKENSFLLFTILPLAFLCFAIPLTITYLFKLLVTVTISTFSLPEDLTLKNFRSFAEIFDALEIFILIFAVILGLLFFLKKFLYKNKVRTETVTWDCGYISPSAKMQYSGSSLMGFYKKFFGNFLKIKVEEPLIDKYFPNKSGYTSVAPDIFLTHIEQLFQKSKEWLKKFLTLQGGRVQIYVSYIIITLIALLIWKLS